MAIRPTAQPKVKKAPKIKVTPAKPPSAAKNPPSVSGIKPSERVTLAAKLNKNAIQPVQQTAGAWAPDPRAGGSTGGTTTTATTTTVTTSKFDNGVMDISIIPFIRHSRVSFSARGLRPNRRVWFFFDGTDVTNYIIKPDEVILSAVSTAAQVPSTLSPSQDYIDFGTLGANTHNIVAYGRWFDTANANTAAQDTGNDRARNRKLYLNNRNGQVRPGGAYTLNHSGNTGTVLSYVARGGENLTTWFTSTTSNTVILPIHTSQMANNYWGTNGANSINFLPSTHKRHLPLTANIVSFNNVTRELMMTTATGTLSNLLTAASSLNDNVTVNTDPDDISWSMGVTHYTDFEGNISGTFSIPAGRFRTGERQFRIIDVPDNDVEDCTTRAEYMFDASGLQQTRGSIAMVQSVVSSATTIRPPVTPTPPPLPRRSAPSGDPIAQTFFVDASDYPNGFFITSVDLFFRTKDNILPVRVEIRPTVNGYPSSTTIIPGGTASVLSEHVNLSENASSATRFTFNNMVYLAPGEYALVVRTDSLEYEVFVSELGSKKIGTNNIVSEQPYVGSFFKSQNASTWDAIQLEDLAFVIYKAVFSTSGTAVLSSKKPKNDITADSFFTHLNDIEYANTEITYTHSYPGASASSYELENEIIPASRVLLTSTSAKYNLNATLTTGSVDISPVLLVDTGKFVSTQNYIDNANLAQSDFAIIDTLGGFAANANVELTITSAFGTGAVAFANANASGNITSIHLAASGYGYLDNVVVSITSTGDYNVITVATETAASGGPAMAKYISRPVTLAPGFDANDLKVYLTAFKPIGTDVLVYFKVKSANDPEPFDRKLWTMMTEESDTDIYSADDAEYTSAIEMEFIVPGSQDDIAFTYTTESETYTYFNQFAIKIIMLSDDTTRHPIIYDMRAIALPL